MASPGTLGVQATRTGEAMPPVIVPDTFGSLLAAFQPCFTAPSYRNFCLLVSGWLHCSGRRTVTAVALAAGVVGVRHISVFHRFFGRATWSLDAVGRPELDGWLLRRPRCRRSLVEAALAWLRPRHRARRGVARGRR